MIMFLMRAEATLREVGMITEACLIEEALEELRLRKSARHVLGRVRTQVVPDLTRDAMRNELSSIMFQLRSDYPHIAMMLGEVVRSLQPREKEMS